MTYKDDKVTDLAVTGENFKGKFAKQNENDYLPKAVNKIKDQVVGLNIKDQTAFDKVDTVSGATTSATAIKNAAMEALGLTPKQEILAEAPETVKAGTYEIQMKNVTDIVDHSLSAADHDKKVTATLKVDENGKMTLSYPVISNTVTEPLEVLGFNGYYNGSALTKDGVEVTSDDEGIVTNVNMPLTGAKPQQTYKANFKLYVPSMANLNGTYDEIEINNGKFNSDATITLYWDTLKEVKDQTVLADGIYKVDAKMLRADGTGSTSMTDKAITHKVKLTVKDGKYYVTLNFKGIEVFGEKAMSIRSSIWMETKQRCHSKFRTEIYRWESCKDDYGTNYPDLVTFPMTDEAVKYSVVPMQVYVAIMENMTPGSGTQKVNLSLDLSSAVKTTANDKDFNSEDVIESAKVTAPQTPAGVKAASCRS
ncbi:MAG: NEAT domain-containing protein [Anaerostipes hadrus]